MLERNIDTSVLAIGQTIKNYKELCALLHQKVLGGKSKILQLENFKRYFDYEKSGHKFIITDIYNEPLEKNDKRKYGNNSIYTKHIEIILLQYLLKQEGFTKTITKQDWWKILGMVNIDYNKIKRKNLIKIAPFVTNWEISHFYQRCNKKLGEILFSALNNLKNRKLIIYEIQILIKDKNNNSFIAADKQKQIIEQEEKYILQEMGFDKIIQIIYQFKQKEFYKKVNERLNVLYGWKQYLKLVKISSLLKDDLKCISDSEITIQKELFNQKIIEILCIDTDKKYYTEKEKLEELKYKFIQSIINESEPPSIKGLLIIPDNYTEAQYILIDELIDINKRVK